MSLRLGELTFGGRELLLQGLVLLNQLGERGHIDDGELRMGRAELHRSKEGDGETLRRLLEDIEHLIGLNGD